MLFICDREKYGCFFQKKIILISRQLHVRKNSFSFNPWKYWCSLWLYFIRPLNWTKTYSWSPRNFIPTPPSDCTRGNIAFNLWTIWNRFEYFKPSCHYEWILGTFLWSKYKATNTLRLYKPKEMAISKICWITFTDLWFGLHLDGALLLFTWLSFLGLFSDSKIFFFFLKVC